MMQALKMLDPKLSNITIPVAGAPVEIWAILDPLSKTAQKVAPVLDFLQKTLGIALKVGCTVPQFLILARPRSSFSSKSFHRAERQHPSEIVLQCINAAQDCKSLCSLIAHASRNSHFRSAK